MALSAVNDFNFCITFTFYNWQVKNKREMCRRDMHGEKLLFFKVFDSWTYVKWLNGSVEQFVSIKK